jgi:hypothetical protein
MPDALNPTLSNQNRLELLEYYKAGQSDSTVNRYGNQARLLAFDTIHQAIVVKNTPVTTFEMKVFNQANGNPIVGIIYTACAPVCQSTIHFYDTAWNRVPIRFTMPKAIEWLNKDSLANENTDRQWIENVLENNFISLAFDPERPTIISKNNSLEFMSEADRKIISPYMKDLPIIFELKDHTWVRKP